MLFRFGVLGRLDGCTGFLVARQGEAGMRKCGRRSLSPVFDTHMWCTLFVPCDEAETVSAIHLPHCLRVRSLLLSVPKYTYCFVQNVASSHCFV